MKHSMSSEERHNELSEEFDKLTSELKEMSSNDPGYARIWNERAEIKNEMYRLEKSITG